MGILTDEQVQKLKSKYPDKKGSNKSSKRKKKSSPKPLPKLSVYRYCGDNAKQLRYAAAGFLSGKLPVKPPQPKPFKISSEGVFRTSEKRKSLSTVGYVYFIQGRTTKLVKIGVSRGCPITRLRNMQVGSPDVLDLLGVLPTDRLTGLEKELHAQWEKIWSHGEWHFPDPELLRYIGVTAKPHFPNCMGECESKRFLGVNSI